VCVCVCVCVGWGIYHLRSGSALLSACPARSLARSRTTAKAVLAWVDQAKPVVWKTKKKQIQNAVGIVSVRCRRLSLCQSVPPGPIPSRTSQNAVLKMPLNSALAVAEERKEKGKENKKVSYQLLQLSRLRPLSQTTRQPALPVVAHAENALLAIVMAVVTARIAENGREEPEAGSGPGSEGDTKGDDG
jgi:hypothetical protein